MKSVRTNFALGILVIICLALVSNAWAGTTRIAASCSRADIQTQITASSDGDTVQVPAGTCTWGAGDTLQWVDKNISIIGGYGGTTTINIQSMFAWITTQTVGKASWRLSGFTLSQTSGINVVIEVYAGAIGGGAGTCPTQASQVPQGWRIDHMTFNGNSYSATLIFVEGLTWGLIDHATNNGNGQLLQTFCRQDYSVDGALYGNCSANLPFHLGSNEAIYIEDTVMNAGGGDSTSISNTDSGAHLVIRHSTINGTMYQTHPTRYTNRGGVKSEIYNNVFNGTCAGCGTGHFIWPIILLSGTGVVFNNAITSYGTNSVQVGNPRTYREYPDYTLANCDGTHPLYDGDVGTGNQTGWPCLDQIGWQGPYPAQTNTPLYSWNNGAQCSCFGGTYPVSGSTCTAGACDGSIGVLLHGDQTGDHPWMSDHVKTCGDADPHPAVSGAQDPCGDGHPVDYVNNGKTPKPGYTPYTYPHPLQGGGGQGLAAPQNLRIGP